MDMVQSVLQEQLEYALESERRYKEAIEELPRGSLSKKKINDHYYYYLVYRDGGKVKSEYLGKLFDEEIEEYRKKIEKRRLYQEILKNLSDEIKYLKKVLNVKAD